ncbi:MAG: hypothetical protein R2729_19610 [Bryobacteraceae bacterium]
MFHRTIVITAIAISAAFAGSPAPAAASRQLTGLRTRAAAAASDALRLEAMIGSEQFSSQTGLSYLAGLENDLHRIGTEVAGLYSRKDKLTPGEREAVETIVPFMEDAALASNEATTHPRGYAERIARDAHQVAAILDAYAGQATVANAARSAD